VVNQEFARRFFHDANPVGRTFHASNDKTYQIIGVCADWRVDRFRDPIRPAFYAAVMQEPDAGTVNFAIKIAGDQAGVAKEVRELMRSIDPNLAIADIRTERQQIESALSQERFMASLAATFGALALLLASIGIYGVMAYAVARRTKEIGIRVALGARSGNVAWIVLRETLLLAALGVAIGLPSVLGVSPALDHFLAPGWRSSFAYGLKPNDPLIMALTALVLAAAGLFAGYLPARRAARIDPMVALRYD
jgi:ABC-type antimicrobial peptide transport system permease subunit